MGQLHLDIYVQRLLDDYQCRVHVGRPQVAYKERPRRIVPFEYRLKKQNGGQGQFAHIVGRLEPLLAIQQPNLSFAMNWQEKDLAIVHSRDSRRND